MVKSLNLKVYLSFYSLKDTSKYQQIYGLTLFVIYLRKYNLTFIQRESHKMSSLFFSWKTTTKKKKKIKKKKKTIKKNKYHSLAANFVICIHLDCSVVFMILVAYYGIKHTRSLSQGSFVGLHNIVNA